MSKTIKERVYEQIYERILRGSLPLGTRLTEVGLAKELGVSRTPVREALAQLVHEGLAVNVPGEGIFLRESTRHDLVELFQMRTIYEVFAVQEIMTSPSPAVLGQLAEAVSGMRQLAVEIRDGISRTQEERWRDVCQYELTFHLAMVNATQNSRLVRSYSDTVLLVQTICCFDAKSMLTWSEIVFNYYQHRRILGVIRSGNIARAEKLIRKHLQIGLDEALRQYDTKYPANHEPPASSVWLEVLR